MKTWPLVSVGLPTYNRATTLKRAIESVLAQDYPNFELIISDNASTDGTQTICEDFYRRDNRIRYLRQASNVGPIANFEAVLDAARGEFFMWLADDDWLDPHYVAECERMLAGNSDYELVCGRGKYFEGEQFRFSEVPINLAQDSSSERVLSYYLRVDMNGMFYGVMRRKVLADIEIRDLLGVDWLMMAQIAFFGKVRTLETVFVNRSLAGASRTAETLVSFHRLPRFLAKDLFLFVAIAVFRDIAWKSQAYKPLGRLKRILLAARSASAVARRHWFSVRILDPWNNLRTKVIFRTRLMRCLRASVKLLNR